MLFTGPVVCALTRVIDSYVRTDYCQCVMCVHWVVAKVCPGRELVQ